MMDGRVKTLHPKVHGGLLGRRQIDDLVMAKHGINRIDVLVVNLYPFEKMAGQHMDLRIIDRVYRCRWTCDDPGSSKKFQKCCSCRRP